MNSPNRGMDLYFNSSSKFDTTDIAEIMLTFGLLIHAEQTP
jgi:hypothetical protein